jgi:hypothetical protein
VPAAKSLPWGHVSTDDRKQSGLSITTLVIASCSSLAAAAVVSRVWGGGTLVGAAVTPVIVALVSEGLKKPATVISTVRETRTTTRRYDPVAEGRRGAREGDLAMARTQTSEGTERTVHHAGRRAPRRPLVLAIATGLVAFAIAAVLLTSTDLVLGRSVTGSGQRTTLFSGSSSSKKSDKSDSTTTDQKTTPSQTSTTPTTTSTTPTATTPTTPTQTSTTPNNSSTPAPAQTEPPSSAQPAPAPAPVTPPASTAPSSP